MRQVFTRLHFAGFPCWFGCSARATLQSWETPDATHDAAKMGIVRVGCGGKLSQTVLYSRRVTPRADVDDSVHALWFCNSQGDVSRVWNINVGGMFIETSLLKAVGTPVELYFLVSEGQIRAKAVVRHVEPGRGLGLKLTSMHDQDRLHFGALLRRLYSARCVQFRAAAPAGALMRDQVH